MTLLVKDANTTVQPISTQLDAAANLVPVHAPASISGGIATPVTTSAPLPVINTAGAVAVDGSGTIASPTQAQTLFGSTTPANGYIICNNTGAALFVIDGGTAATNIGFYLPNTGIFMTPSGYRPLGPVSIYGGTTNGNFTARRW